MNGVPSVGGTRGIFEIFIPGAFLLLNITCVVYVWSGSGSDIRQFITTVSSQSVVGLAVLVSFGYLLGVVLRLLKTSAPDRWSGYFGWLICKIKGKSGEAFLEQFPYSKHIEKVARKKLPEDVQKFYIEFWGKSSADGNREFFNYCKTIINALDDKSASEIYAAEALTRYVASMFYALLTSFVLVIAAAVANSSPGLIVFVCTYFTAIIVILRHLRFLRVKEVETVFAAAMRNYYTDKWPKVIVK